MYLFYNFLTDLLKIIAAAPVQYAIGGLFIAEFGVFAVCIIIGLFLKRQKPYLKKFFLMFTNFAALSAFIYCLAESVYASGFFNLLTSLLTVSLFYAASILKYFFYPVGSLKKRKAISQTRLELLRQKLKAAEILLPENNGNISERNELSAIFKKLSKGGAVCPQPQIDLDKLPEFTDKLSGKQLSGFDREQIDKLHSLAFKIRSKGAQDGELNELNEGLAGLLKMLAKYQV